MKKPLVVWTALILTLFVIILGYIMLGMLPSFLFAFGFLGGFILWLIKPSTYSFEKIKAPYLLTFLFFIIHKFEERFMDFFPALSKITGVAVPDTNSPLVYVLYACACAWFFIPFLLKRSNPFGQYLAWTFFTSMGITELAHFIFPLFLSKPYSYFPGMISALLLAPAAWWGILRLTSKTE